MRVSVGPSCFCKADFSDGKVQYALLCLLFYNVEWLACDFNSYVYLRNFAFHRLSSGFMRFTRN